MNYSFDAAAVLEIKIQQQQQKEEKKRIFFFGDHYIKFTFLQFIRMTFDLSSMTFDLSLEVIEKR